MSMNQQVINVTKRDGRIEPYDGYEIARSIEDAARGLDSAVARATQIQSELEITLFEKMTTEQLDEAVIQVALGNVKDDPAFDTIAARLLTKTLYKKVLGETHDLFGDVSSAGLNGAIRQLHREQFAGYIEGGVRLGLLDTRFPDLFDLEALAAVLEPERDDLLHYIGIQTMRTRYMITDHDRRPLEVPQFFWMRVSMGLSLNEADPTAVAIDFYHAMSKLEYVAAGSTLVNAGTSYAQLSNCFVMQMEDDIEHIAKSVRDVMWLTKGTGGIGLSVSKLRSEGSPIRSNNTTSTGPIPFMHTIDSTLRAISRGGKKFGALCFYMENWHLDFAQFLDLKANSGDPYRRARTANTAVWISDEFMIRVREDAEWYLFDPLETPDLVELYGSAFSARYAEYVAMAEAGQLRRFKKLRAREQYQAILISLQTTSHPWLTWKDTINTRALNNNTGTIHLSNLCTEVCLPQDRDNVAVCNLASINLSRHLIEPRPEFTQGRPTINFDSLAHAARSAVRQLDNLIDITVSSVDESEHSNAENRAVGLGVMGFTDVVERLGLSYESEAAYTLIDELMEFISWHAIDASADLSRERGPYPNFLGSSWSKGEVPIDTLDRLEADRGVPVLVDRSTRLDWDALRVKVRGGIRNATLLAIAPTASIGLVAGTTPGLDPQFSQLFSRATSSGKFLEVNRNLVADLKARGLWEEVREDLLRHQGDVSRIEAVPAELKAIYRTSFQLSGHAFLHVAARAQKWIDQAISRNIYLQSRDINEMAELYSAAWELGVKTTYYLHMMPRHTAEQSTVKVNKAAELNGAGAGGARRGFGGARRVPQATAAPAAPQVTPAPAPTQPAEPVEAPVGRTSPVEAPKKRGFGFATVAAVTTVPASEPVVPEGVEEIEVVDGAACPVDPMERLQCDSCQ